VSSALENAGVAIASVSSVYRPTILNVSSSLFVIKKHSSYVDVAMSSSLQ
jgi:hypothetical protein